VSHAHYIFIRVAPEDMFNLERSHLQLSKIKNLKNI